MISHLQHLKIIVVKNIVSMKCFRRFKRSFRWSFEVHATYYCYVIPVLSHQGTVSSWWIEGRKVLHIFPPSSGALYYSPHQSKELLEKIKLSMDSTRRVLQWSIYSITNLCQWRNVKGWRKTQIQTQNGLMVAALLRLTLLRKLQIA